MAAESGGAWRVMSGWADAHEGRAAQQSAQWRAATPPALESAASVTAAEAANLLRLGPYSSGSGSVVSRPQQAFDQAAAAASAATDSAALCWGEEAAASSWEAHAQQQRAQQRQRQLQQEQACEYAGSSDMSAATAVPSEAALADFSALLGGGGGADLLMDMLSDGGRAPEHEVCSCPLSAPCCVPWQLPLAQLLLNFIAGCMLNSVSLVHPCL